MARSRTRDDDYEDDYDDSPRRRPPEGGGGKTAVMIVGIIAAVVLVIFLVCGGLVFYGCYSVKRSAESMQAQAFSQMEKMQVENQARMAEAEKSDKRVSKKAAEAFLVEIKARRFDAAYALTSIAYHKRTPLNAFETFATKNFEALTGFGMVQEDFFAPDEGKTFVVTKKAHVNGGFVDVSITMIKEGIDWKVDRLAAGQDTN